MKTTKRTWTAGLIAAALVAAPACVTPGKNTATGAAVGGIVGAGAGALAGGWKGAAVGAGAGAVAGGAIGNYVDKRQRELAQLAETKKTEHGLLVNMQNDLLFDVNSATLRPEGEQRLTQMGDILAKYPQDRLRIEGHTDSTGTDAYNAGLSERRAEAVARVLRGRGVKDPQLTAQGKGEREPVASNATADGRQANRRVELVIDMPETYAQK